MKLGTFKVAGELIREEDKHHLLKLVQANLAILRTEDSVFDDATTFYAIHDDFEDIEQGAAIPQYSCEVSTDENNNKTISWRKL